MPIVNPVDSAAPTTTARDIITDALQEINAIGVGEAPSAEDAAKGLRKLQRMMDRWNAQQVYLFGYTFLTFALIPNHHPHTIGPGADWVTSVRPQIIKAANLLLPGGSQPVRVPMSVRDDVWWMSEVRIPTLTSTFPTNVYYNPLWPKGELNFWPISTSSDSVELEVWGALDQVNTLDSIISLPPGYWDAIVYTLAVSLLPAFEKPPNPALVELARQALKTILSANTGSPRMSTNQAGMPGRTKAVDFNFLTGEPW